MAKAISVEEPGIVTASAKQDVTKVTSEVGEKPVTKPADLAESKQAKGKASDVDDLSAVKAGGVGVVAAQTLGPRCRRRAYRLNPVPSRVDLLPLNRRLHRSTFTEVSPLR